jgi:hypothetical protein
MRIISDSGWKQLTSHQQIRKIALNPQTPLGEVAEIIAGFGDPFGGKGRITHWILGLELTIHAMKYGA